MTRNTLMGGVLAGILFLSSLALADDVLCGRTLEIEANLMAMKAEQP